MNHRLLLFGFVAILVLTAGCMDMESSATINEDGEVEEFGWEIEFTDEGWEFLEYMASFEHDSVESFILEGDPGDEYSEDAEDVDCAEGAESIEVDERQQRIALTCTEPVVQDETSFYLGVEDDGRIVFSNPVIAEWQELEQNQEMDVDVDEMSFSVTMYFPSEVTESNAHEVEGNRATWEMTEFEGDEIHAETASASGQTSDTGETVDDEGDDNSGEGEAGADDGDAAAGDGGETEEAVGDDEETEGTGGDAEVEDEGDQDDDGDSGAFVTDTSKMTASGILIAGLLGLYYVVRRT